MECVEVWQAVGAVSLLLGFLRFTGARLTWTNLGRGHRRPA
ncbi:hypothetical protein ACH4GK_37530 [Streptomyces rimosus]|nr:hypothetical protein [Streptomyces rimosus]